jgi:hypothetical protein
MTQLRAACPHGRWEAHDYIVTGKGWVHCPGGRLLPADTLIIERDERGNWPFGLRYIARRWAARFVSGDGLESDLFDSFADLNAVALRSATGEAADER